MSTYKSVADVIQQTQYWLRLATFKHGPLHDSLLSVLHNKSNDPNYIGLPDNPTDLYWEFTNTHLGIINRLKKRRVLQQDQIDLLIPPGDNKTYSDKFDITLIVVLIRNCTTLAPPLNGWGDKNPPANDIGFAANVIRAREWRNFVHHTEPNSIDMALFNMKWTDGAQIVNALGNNYDLKKLKTIPLDPKHQLVLKSLFTFMGKLQKKQSNQDYVIDQIQDGIDNQDRIIDQIQTEITEFQDGIDKQDRIIDKIQDSIDEHGHVIDQIQDEINDHVHAIDQIQYGIDDQNIVIGHMQDMVNGEILVQLNTIKNAVEELEKLPHQDTPIAGLGS
jgi:Uncharacterized protein conserved in bacteria